MKSYHVLFPDGKEFQVDVGDFSTVKQEIDKLVSKQGYTTSRKNPKTLSVGVSLLSIKNGNIHCGQINFYHVTPPLERMSADEYEDEKRKLLKDLPEEFHGDISYHAWETGHSSGYEEVISHLSDLVDMIKDPIKKYTERIKK